MLYYEVNYPNILKPQPNEEDLPYDNFKKDKNGRSFHTTWLFCLHCILFGKNSQKAWTKDGFSSWSRAVLSIHSTSRIFRSSY